MIRHLKRAATALFDRIAPSDRAWSEDRFPVLLHAVGEHQQRSRQRTTERPSSRIGGGRHHHGSVTK